MVTVTIFSPPVKGGSERGSRERGVWFTSNPDRIALGLARVTAEEVEHALAPLEHQLMRLEPLQKIARYLLDLNLLRLVSFGSGLVSTAGIAYPGRPDRHYTVINNIELGEVADEAVVRSCLDRCDHVVVDKSLP